METIERQTAAGAIIGELTDTLEIYRGIPYAKSPVNKLRFKHSILKTAWDETPLNATAFKAIPPQPYNRLEAFFETQLHHFTQSEDCLFLNIWKPNKKAKHKPLPVIIWFYGGGFMNGHGSAELYRPDALSEHLEAIVITFNYRLGALGYLNWQHLNAAFDMNCGLSDQLTLLQWVEHFISAFDGDPNHVTLMGQSAGAMSIQALMHMKAAAPLFHRAVLMSGVLTFDTIAHSADTAAHFQHLAQTTCACSAEQLCTTDILLVMAQDIETRGPSKGLELIYRPIFDSKTMSKQVLGDKPILAGYTDQEGTIYIRNESRKLSLERFLEVARFNHIAINQSRFDLLTGKGQADAVTYYYFEQPIWSWLTQYPSSSKWLYRFDWCQKSSQHFKTPYHILDVVFWLGHLDILTRHGTSPTAHEYALSYDMQTVIRTFLQTETCPWPAYNEAHPYPFIFN